MLNAAGEITANKAGLWTGSCQFTFPAGQVDLIPGIGSAHPYVGFLVAESFRLSFTPGLWRLSMEYVGGSVDSSDPQYELSPGTGNEPIETHKSFLSVIAGKPSAPLNGAIFRNVVTGDVSEDDTAGVAQFDRFSIYVDGALNAYAGQEQFINQNNTVWTKSWTSKSKPSSYGIHIGAPDGPNPDYGGTTNWLAMPIAYTQRGNVFSNVARWIASGPRGWNPGVYPSS